MKHLISLTLALAGTVALLSGRQGTDFPGYVPDSTTARGVAAPVLQGMFGADYLRKMEPLVARRVQGYWVVEGESKSLDPTNEFEPYTLVIDPMSGRIVLSGFINVESELQRMIGEVKARSEGLLNGEELKAIQIAWEKFRSEQGDSVQMRDYSFSQKRVGDVYEVEILSKSGGRRKAYRIRLGAV